MHSLALLLACVPAETAASPEVRPWPCEGEPVVTWSGFGAGFVRSYCASCHTAGTPDRHGAPESPAFDTFDTFASSSERIRARVLDAGDMPPGGGISDEELAHLDVLLRCGL